MSIPRTLPDLLARYSQVAEKITAAGGPEGLSLDEVIVVQIAGDGMKRAAEDELARRAGTMAKLVELRRFIDLALIVADRGAEALTDEQAANVVRGAANLHDLVAFEVLRRRETPREQAEADRDQAEREGRKLN